MPRSKASRGFGKGIVVGVLAAAVVGGIVWLAASRGGGIGGLLKGAGGEGNAPPPPSEAVETAPGPDNTVTRMPERPGAPEAPPSPIRVEPPEEQEVPP